MTTETKTANTPNRPRPVRLAADVARMMARAELDNINFSKIANAALRKELTARGYSRKSDTY
jgi:hypothetical protein